MKMFGDRPTVGQRVLVSLMGVQVLLPEPFPGACMKITEKDVLHTATLAHLHLSQEEITQTAEDLKNILTCFNKLKDLGAHYISPFAHPKEKENRLRQDSSEESLPNKLITLAYAFEQNTQWHLNKPAVFN
jgi:aspartyl-tRNA(Asn)/glutamyl-tRNA(Gln) amidotransferase subunit C